MYVENPKEHTKQAVVTIIQMGYWFCQTWSHFPLPFGVGAVVGGAVVLEVVGGVVAFVVGGAVVLAVMGGAWVVSRIQFNVEVVPVVAVV